MNMEDELKPITIEIMLAELTEYINNIDRLPPHARSSPATNADLAYVGTMVLSILQTMDGRVNRLEFPDYD
jgi:hypothetical protein